MMIKRWLAVRGGFDLVVVRPVVEGSSEPGAACFAAGFAATSLGVVIHGGCPQVVVLQVMLRPVGEKSALRARGAGCRLEEGALFKGRLVRSDRPISATKRIEKKKDDLP